jgi:hypothetical protein
MCRCCLRHDGERLKVRQDKAAIDPTFRPLSYFGGDHAASRSRANGQ